MIVTHRGRSPHQLKLLGAIIASEDANGHPALLKDLAAAAGYSSHGAVRRAVATLAKRGDVAMSWGHRTLKPTAQGRRVLAAAIAEGFAR